MAIPTAPLISGDSREAVLFALALSIAASEDKIGNSWTFKPGTTRDEIESIFAVARACLAP